MISPRAVADIHSACIQQKAPPSLLEASINSKHEDEIRRLKQENMQLRRDLIDANNRIRQLELTQPSTSLFMPSESEDDFSVEISVTSSTTTEQVSNLASASAPAKVSESVQRIEEKEDKERTISEIIKARGARYHRLTQRSRLSRNPFSNAKPRKMPGAELRRLFSSDSESSSLSSITEASSTAGVSGDIAVVDTVPMMRKEIANRASSHAPMNYFQRAQSADSSDQTSETDESSGIRFEV